MHEIANLLVLESYSSVGFLFFRSSRAETLEIAEALYQVRVYSLGRSTDTYRFGALGDLRPPPGSRFTSLLSS